MDILNVITREYKASERRDVVLGETGTVEISAITGRHIYQPGHVLTFLLMLVLFSMYGSLML